VKGRSAQSDAIAWTMLSWSASGILAICCDLTRPIITRLARTFQSTRTRRCREQYMPLVALCQRHVLADSIIYMCVFDFRQAQVAWLVSHLQSQQLLDANYDSTSGGVSFGSNFAWLFRLTMLGWEKYSELKSKRSDSRTAFMAMKFGDAVLDAVVDNHFKPAVIRAGFELRKLTDNQPAGSIDDQIRASILSGRFVIADLTHGNRGAYWEAGFAEGLGLPVIYTCEKTTWDKEKTHFDTNHLVTIIWDPAKPEEAGTALTATIRATFRAEARQTN
jgi:hypothetical protein